MREISAFFYNEIKRNGKPQRGMEEEETKLVYATLDPVSTTHGRNERGNLSAVDREIVQGWSWTYNHTCIKNSPMASSSRMRRVGSNSIIDPCFFFLLLIIIIFGASSFLSSSIGVTFRLRQMSATPFFLLSWAARLGAKKGGGWMGEGDRRE